jgi:hypothetical protein
VSTRFDWRLDHAAVHPARVAVAGTDSRLGIDLAAGHGEPGRSFWIRGMRWRLGPPLPSPLAG